MSATEDDMSRLRNNVAGYRSLREFYEACGLSPEIIEGALKLRYEEPARLRIGIELSPEVSGQPIERPRCALTCSGPVF
jgi:hypothetical protein